METFGQGWKINRWMITPTRLLFMLTAFCWGACLLLYADSAVPQAVEEGNRFTYIYGGVLGLIFLALVVASILGTIIILVRWIINAQNRIRRIGRAIATAVAIFLVLILVVSSNFSALMYFDHLENATIGNNQFALGFRRDGFIGGGDYIVVKCDQWMFRCTLLQRFASTDLVLDSMDINLEPVHLNVTDERIEVTKWGTVIYSYPAPE